MKKQKDRHLDNEISTDNILEKIAKYSILETIAIFLLYISVGYLIHPHDICSLNSEISYITILLVVVTLFHGLESGLLMIGLLSLCMWYFYPEFYYVKFLMAMIIALICGEFHYYWTKKVRKYKINSDYRDTKLLELSKSFYALKISHDQLEKNYVFKSMSLRNSILSIKKIKGKQDRYFQEFLNLIENTFQIKMSLILHKNSFDDAFKIVAKSEGTKKQKNVDFSDALIELCLESKKPVYISDHAKKQSDYIAVIPTSYKDKTEGMLLIEKMPFMSFNKENLISIAIMFDYFFAQIRNQNTLEVFNHLSMISDNEFRLECNHLERMYQQYQVDSIVLVIKTDDELVAQRLYTMISKLLRSLDKVTFVPGLGYFFIALVFPFSNKDTIEGFIKRLFMRLDDISLSDFEQISFDMSQIDLMDQFLRLENAKR